MARLRLKNPVARTPNDSTTDWVVVDVAVDAPVPHLDGIYSYKTSSELALVGSVVQVPFGQSDAIGFIVGVRPFEYKDGMLKSVAKFRSAPLLDGKEIDRYQSIADSNGTSLISVLKLAIPVWKDISLKESLSRTSSLEDVKSIPKDAAYLQRLFGKEWSMRGKGNIQLPPGIRWEQVAVSIFLADPRPTLLLVPTESALHSLEKVLRSRGVNGFISLTSGGRKSDRHAQYQKLIYGAGRLLIGTRSAGFAPFPAERIIVIDPADSHYREQRSPYLRAGSYELWKESLFYLTISHSRNLEAVALGERFIEVAHQGKYNFISTSMERVVADLAAVLKRRQGLKSILICINDKSFASGLICQKCRNRAHCECGFPLSIRSRGQSPSCSKCLKVHEAYSCRFCGGSAVIATKIGGEALALTLAKSIRNSKVILSSSSVYKDEVKVSETQNTIVIATYGCEPRLVSGRGGYDIVVLLGGRAAFNSSSIKRIDNVRVAWGRTLGFLGSVEGTILVDLEPEHPDFLALQLDKSPKAAEMILAERRMLNLPPYSVLVELSGADGVLQKLRVLLLQDELFKSDGNIIFPVQNGKCVIRVSRVQSQALLRLLHSMIRIRSAKKLPPVTFRVEPEES